MEKRGYSMARKTKSPERSRRIMIADDDPSILDALQQIFESEGYEVETSVDGETVAKIHEFCPDLLLLDIWMSGIDGRDICKKLKSQPKTQHIPIIMISANNDTKGIAKAVGADDFIAKPFDMQDLLAKVAQHIK